MTSVGEVVGAGIAPNQDIAREVLCERCHAVLEVGVDAHELGPGPDGEERYACHEHCPHCPFCGHHRHDGRPCSAPTDDDPPDFCACSHPDSGNYTRWHPGHWEPAA